MAVLVEGISVVVRKDAMQSKMAGGEERFRLLIPNSTYCDDGELARVGFMAPADVQAFVEELVDAGLTFMEDGQCVDIAVCDQQKGPTADCRWLEFAHLPVGAARSGPRGCTRGNESCMAFKYHPPR